MAKRLIDALWRDHPDAPARGARGPKSRRSTAEVVESGIALAGESGAAAVTVRAVADSLSMAPMSVYTHVASRDDLLVLMVDAAHAAMSLPVFGRTGWRTRVCRICDANLELFQDHSWLLDVHDDRVALGPGTIAKYDHELQAFDGTGLDDMQRDAALSFVLGFVRVSAASLIPRREAEDFQVTWEESVEPLGHYLGGEYPLARRVGRAAGEHMGAPYSAEQAWTFGLERVIAALADLIGG